MGTSRRRTTGLPRIKPLPTPKPPKPPAGLKGLPGLKPLKGLKNLPGSRSQDPPQFADPGVLEQIRHALTARHPITATYSGKHRELSPIALGTKDREDRLWAYQFGGESTHKPKCFIVAKLTGVEVQREPWQEPMTDPGPDDCMDVTTQRVSSVPGLF